MNKSTGKCCHYKTKIMPIVGIKKGNRTKTPHNNNRLDGKDWSKLKHPKILYIVLWEDIPFIKNVFVKWHKQ